MEYNDFKEAVIAAAKKAGLKEYELYYAADSQISVDVIKQEVTGFSNSESGGMCFRCIVNEKMGYSGTELFTEEEAIDLVARAVENATSIESDEKVFIYDGKDEYQKVNNKIFSYPSDQMINQAIELNRLTCSMDKRISDSSDSSLITVAEKISICNSYGLDLTSESSLVAAVTGAIATENNDSSVGFLYKLGDLASMDMNELAREAADTAITQLHPGKVESGTKKVVFSGKMMATMLSTFASVFYAENAQKGLSLLNGKENSRIASEAVTLIDDPFYCDSTSKRAFDAEGVATKKKEVISQGVLTTLLYNLKTAHIAGVESTANASKMSYDSSVETSPYTFYIKPDNNTEEEIFAKAGEAIYVTEIQGMHAGADPKTGDFSLAAGGYLIKNGVKGECVKGFTIAGNFYDLLKKVLYVGDTLDFLIPRGQSWIGSPLVVVSEVSIAGSK